MEGGEFAYCGQSLLSVLALALALFLVGQHRNLVPVLRKSRIFCCCLFCLLSWISMLDWFTVQLDPRVTKVVQG